ncbi:MAG: hypothetical protein KDK97_16755 [Verrucomicrobiales bacterium]|nr:hypothetical protein [Verrucomicrobiales bacterium]MCP5559100.1 glycosyl transferase [Verrucomicrobiaceae bacterium]
MADFFQHAQIPTLHHLAEPDPASVQADLLKWSADRPIALLLPALFAECERPALPHILDEVSQASYVREIVVSMNGMDAEQLQLAKTLFRDRLPDKIVHILWNDGPEMDAIHQHISGPENLHRPGKGANIWAGLLYLKAKGHRGIVVSHDTDIMNYSRSMLAKLCYPLLHPSMPYKFSKGYYSRVSGRLYGRVTRLLIFPLIEAFRQVLGETPLLQHLAAFRYPLSGEFAGNIDTIADFHLPSGWGLEIATLCETHRKLPNREQCQVDLGFHFEHRHRTLEHGPTPLREQGLVTAAAEVARCLAFHLLRDADPRGSEGLLRLALERYRATAAEWLERYEHVALINGLEHDRIEEETAVAAFTEALEILARASAIGGLKTEGTRPPPASALIDNPTMGKAILDAAISV